MRGYIGAEAACCGFWREKEELEGGRGGMREGGILWRFLLLWLRATEATS